VEPEAVKVVVPNPHERVVDDEPPHLVAAAPVVVDRWAPRSAVPLGEVRTKLPQEVADRAEVVVDDVEQYAKAPCVAGVHQALEPVRAAVRVMRGVEGRAVVAPPAVTPELPHRHQLDGRDAEADEMGQAFDGGVESALGGEGSDVQLVQD